MTNKCANEYEANEELIEPINFLCENKHKYDHRKYMLSRKNQERITPLYDDYGRQTGTVSGHLPDEKIMKYKRFIEDYNDKKKFVKKKMTHPTLRLYNEEKDAYIEVINQKNGLIFSNVGISGYLEDF